MRLLWIKGKQFPETGVSVGMIVFMLSRNFRLLHSTAECLAAIFVFAIRWPRAWLQFSSSLSDGRDLSRNF